MMVSRRRVSTIAMASILTVIMIVALAVPAAVATWLGIAALGAVGWPLVVDVKSPSVVAVGHLGLIASCYALGVHDEHRTVWLTMLATFIALPLAWVVRRSGRPVKGAAGLLTVGVTFGVFAWSAEQLDGPLSALTHVLLWGTTAGIILITQAVRPAKPPSVPAPTVEPEPPMEPALPQWARDVT